jgi:hypothetical protein
MKKLYIILALAIFATVAIQAQTVSVTFRVTLKGTGKKLSADGLRVTGALGATEQVNWDPTVAKKMTLVGTAADSIYAVTLNVTRPADSKLEFKFINGAAWGDGAGGTSEDERTVPADCAKAANDNRVYTIPAGAGPFIAPAYRFNTCTVVFQTGVNELSTAAQMAISPNPVAAKSTLTFANANNSAHSLEILNVTGQVMRTYAPQSGNQFDIERGTLPAGLYFARMKNAIGESRTVKFMMN